MSTIADVLPAAVAALGGPRASDRFAGPQAGDRFAGPQAGDQLVLPEARRIAVLLVDGLGYHLLPAASAVAPTLADVTAGRLGRLQELSSCFPSTTPTSLVSLGTGVRPGEHGVLGFTVKLPHRRRVLTHIAWQRRPDPARWQPVPTQFEIAASAGIVSTTVGRPEFEGSGLTVAAYRGSRFVGAADPDALVPAMLGELAGPARLVYGYHPTVDAMAHRHGIASEQWRAAVREVDRLIERLIDGLPVDAALLVTADHGAIDVPAGARIDLTADPRLRAGIRVVAGEARVRYLHTRRGAREDVIATWRDVLGSAAHVVSRDEAVAAGWFGPVPDAHLPRIGDVVVVCQADLVVLAGKHEPASVGRLVAYHGGMTPAETAIPLISFPA